MFLILQITMINLLLIFIWELLQQMSLQIKN